MASVGAACLILALAVCAFGIAASLYGAATNRRDWVSAGRRSVYALALLATVAFAILEIAFLPLLHSAWWTAVVFSLANAALLRVRIGAEERALAEASGYDRAFAGRPRLIPSGGSETPS